MTISSHLEPESGIVVIRARGDISLDDFRNAIRGLRRTQVYRHTRRVWDLREARFSLSERELTELVSFSRAADQAGTRIALVVARELPDDQILLYQAWRVGVETTRRAFCDLDEAKAWLSDDPGGGEEPTAAQGERA
ncbi:MAG: hypothetical protein V3T16_09630 [Gemmatimonadales bacterium]